MSGKDNRKLNLEYMFKREIYKRIEEDMNCKKKYNNFPQQLFTSFKITKLCIEMCNVRTFYITFFPVDVM